MKILFDDGVYDDVDVERIDDSRYRLLWSPLSSSTAAKLGDVVEVVREGEVWKFVRVAEPSGLETMEIVLTQEIAESTAFHALLDSVRAIGGEWEKAFGGIVLLHFPAEFADEIRSRVAQVLH